MLASSSHYLSPPLIRNSYSTLLPLTVVSAKSSSSNQDVGVLGRTILTELKSNPKQQKQKKPQDERSQQISGSQVLFALQKAAAVKRRESQKMKKQRKKIVGEELSSAGRDMEEEGDVEGGEVRPLCLRSDWGSRLDELEKRLQELSSINIV